jgi:hypothetical protein
MEFTVRLALYILLLNPIVIAALDAAAWLRLGVPTLAAIIALPVVTWMLSGPSMPERRLWTYLAGVQAFYASVIGGVYVIAQGVSGGNDYLLGAGILLLLPAFVILALVAMAAG